MGVKLGTIVKGKQVNKAEISGTNVAIDASHTIMTFLKRNTNNRYTRNRNSKNNRYYSNNEDYMIDRTQRAISHLYGIFYRTIRLMENNILPIYCFDGIPNEMKRLTTKNRYNDFEQTKKRYERALRTGNKNMAKKIALGKEFLWQNSVRETRELLNAMGIPYINSPTEGEAQCAQLVKSGVCELVISSDFDVMLYGAKQMLKIKDLSAKKINGQMYELEETLRLLGLNRFQLIDLSIILGNDYFSGIKGIGLKSGIEFLKKYDNLENIISMIKKKSNIHEISIKENDLISTSKINQIRKLFLMPDVIKTNFDATIHYPNRGAIQTLMCTDHNLNKDRVNKGIQRIIRSYDRLLKSQK